MRFPVQRVASQLTSTRSQVTGFPTFNPPPAMGNLVMPRFTPPPTIGNLVMPTSTPPPAMGNLVMPRFTPPTTIGNLGMPTSTPPLAIGNTALGCQTSSSLTAGQSSAFRASSLSTKPPRGILKKEPVDPTKPKKAVVITDRACFRVYEPLKITRCHAEELEVVKGKQLERSRYLLHQRGISCKSRDTVHAFDVCRNQRPTSLIAYGFLFPRSHNQNFLPGICGITCCNRCKSI